MKSGDFERHRLKRPLKTAGAKARDGALRLCIVTYPR